MSSKRADGVEGILSSFNDAVLILGSTGSVEWINPSAESLFGLSCNLTKGKGIDAVFGRDRELLDFICSAVEKGVSAVSHDTKFHTPKNDETPVSITVSPIEESAGGGAVIILRDLTTAKELERYLGVSDRMAETLTLAAGIAHEIKNPLSGIRGSAQLLGAEIGEELREYTDLIVREADRINRLVVDLIEMNQPDERPTELCNIYPVLDDTLTLMKKQAKEKGVSFTVVYDPSLPQVSGDPDRLRQIFLNLLKNGVEACAPNGNVSVTTSLSLNPPLVLTKRGYIVVRITDDGPGLSEDEKSKVFTPFYSGKKRGTGLGLPIAMRLVKSHGGLLDLCNRKDGRVGATAKVYLPYG